MTMITDINRELAKIGYKAVKIAKLKSWQSWKPQTPAGRKCKANWAMYERLGDFQGIKQWYYGPWCPSNHPTDIAAYYESRWQS